MQTTKSMKLKLDLRFVAALVAAVLFTTTTSRRDLCITTRPVHQPTEVDQLAYNASLGQ